MTEDQKEQIINRILEVTKDNMDLNTICNHYIQTKKDDLEEFDEEELLEHYNETVDDPESLEEIMEE